MSSSHLTTEQHLLNASGLLAVALTATVCCLSYGLWPSLPLGLLFTAAFAMGAYGRRFGLSPSLGRLSVLSLYVLSLCLLWVTKDTAALILSIVMMACAPYHLSSRQCWLLMLVANLGYAAVLSLSGSASTYLFSLLSLLALQAFALSSSLARQREIATKEILERQNSELVAARALVARQSQTEERLRIAGDLHDTIGHQLTALRLNLEALAHQAPEAMQESIQRSQHLSQNLLEEIRSIVRRMADDDGKDLEAAILELGNMTPEISIKVSSALPHLVPELAHQLVFCIQEAISNAIRHGDATQIDIRYEEPVFQISDNGRGLDTDNYRPGFGLNNVDKRLSLFDASAELVTAGNGGACLRIHLSDQYTR